MTREEAIKVLEMFLHKQCDLGRTEFAYDQLTIWDAVKMASDALEQELSWIPVTERLPEEKINPITVDYSEYQCTVRFGNLYDVRSYKYGEGHWRLGAGIVDDYVIAWRELPEPYKEENEE